MNVVGAMKSKTNGNTRNIALGVLVVLASILLIASVLALITGTEPKSLKAEPFFEAQEFGNAGDSAYSIFRYRGEGNVTLILHDGSTSKNIRIINESQAVGATRLGELVASMKELEKYGYRVEVVNETKLGEGIYVVPSGALPWYVLFDLQHNSTNASIIYLGEKGLLISGGIRRQKWFDTLTPIQKSRLVTYNNTLDSLLESGGSLDIAHDILNERWNQKNNITFGVYGEGIRTAAIKGGTNGNLLRVIYSIDGLYGVADSRFRFEPADIILRPAPASIFPWGRSELRFLLNHTNGTAYLVVKKDGRQIENDQLRRVTDENVFIRPLSYSEPGNYIFLVNDNAGNIASGILHVKDLKIRPLGSRGFTYAFEVTEDGVPMDNTEALVWLGNSTSKKKFLIQDGILRVNARLEKGTTQFNFDIYGSQITTPIENSSESLIQFYLQYSIPGIALVLIVFVAARLSRRPTYKLNFGDVAPYARSEVKLSRKQALDVFKKARSDMHLDDSPITPQEFAVSIRRNVTKGADITEGNVESVLKSLADEGKLESHREYFQLKGEGNVKRNALRRIVREKLIEHGLEFTEKSGKFITIDYEIGFINDRFNKKAMIVFDDESSMRKALASLDRTERAKLELRKANQMLKLVSVEALDDVL